MPPRKRVPRDRELRVQQLLGQVVRERRKQTMNQDDFADEVGVYRSHMGRIEQGTLDVRLSTLLALSDALDLPLSDLLRQIEERLAQEDG